MQKKLIQIISTYWSAVLTHFLLAALLVFSEINRRQINAMSKDLSLLEINARDIESELHEIETAVNDIKHSVESVEFDVGLLK